MYTKVRIHVCWWKYMTFVKQRRLECQSANCTYKSFVINLYSTDKFYVTFTMCYLFLVVLYWTSHSIILFRTLGLPVYIHLSQILCQMCLHNIHKQLYCSRKEQFFLDLFSYVSWIHVYKDTASLVYITIQLLIFIIFLKWSWDIFVVLFFICIIFFVCFCCYLMLCWIVHYSFSF